MFLETIIAITNLLKHQTAVQRPFICSRIAIWLVGAGMVEAGKPSTIHGESPVAGAGWPNDPFVNRFTQRAGL